MLRERQRPIVRARRDGRAEDLRTARKQLAYCEALGDDVAELVNDPEN